jgi:hypothetical protein
MFDISCVKVISFISPYINSSNFPINFKVSDFYSHCDPLDLILLVMDPTFFKQVSSSYIVNKFKKSEDYKTAKTLFEMSEIKKNLDRFKKDNTMSLQFDILKCFPLNSNISDSNIYWSLFKYKQHIGASLFERGNKFRPWEYRSELQIFDNLKSHIFHILWCDLETLLISKTFKLQLPYISNDYLIKLLKSYLDLQYRFINIIDLKTGYLKHGLHVLETDYNFKIVKKFKNSEPKFFWYPKFEEYPKTSSLLLTNDAYLIAMFHEGSNPHSSELDSCMFIYSNINPAEDEELKKLKDGLEYVLNNEFILEIKKSFQD